MLRAIALALMLLALPGTAVPGCAVPLGTPALAVSSPGGEGSGVQLSPHAALTAAHVAGEALDLSVETTDGARYPAHVAALWGRDLALLTTSLSLPGPFVVISRVLPPPGAIVIAWGERGGARPARVLASAMDSLLLDLRALPGDSGGGVFWEGRLVAVLRGNDAAGRAVAETIGEVP